MVRPKINATDDGAVAQTMEPTTKIARDEAKTLLSEKNEYSFPYVRIVAHDANEL
jgi:hypothetical protein